MNRYMQIILGKVGDSVPSDLDLTSYVRTRGRICAVNFAVFFKGFFERIRTELNVTVEDDV